MENPDRAMFFAVKRGEFQLARDLYLRGANLYGIYEQEKGEYTSTINLFIKNFSRLAYSKGPNVSQYRQSLEFFNSFVTKTNMECKCVKEHKCPLYLALEAFKIDSQEEVLNCKSDIIRAMIVNGATIKFDEGQNKKADKKLAKWSLRWLDIAGLRSYLITKGYRFIEVQN